MVKDVTKEVKSGYIIGFRSWRVAKENLGNHYYLAGLQPPAIKRDYRFPYAATCYLHADEKDHQAPAPGCSCGWYAYHSLKYIDSWGPGVSIGLVMGWGKVQLHPEGWRAQYMRILAFLDWPGTDSALIAPEYGLPLLKKPALLALAEEWGDLAKDEALPPVTHFEPSGSSLTWILFVVLPLLFLTAFAFNLLLISPQFYVVGLIGIGLTIGLVFVTYIVFLWKKGWSKEE